MPTYVYKSLSQEDSTFEFHQSIHDEALTQHPDSGEPIQRIIAPGVVYHRRGIKKSTIVNKLSPAATACGCASQAVLQSLGMAKATPRYGEAPKIASSHRHGSGGHSHSHSHSPGSGHSCGHDHKH